MNESGFVFLLVLGVSFLLGAAASRFVKNIADYYVAGARMPWYFLTGTFLASNVSAGLFLGATNMTGLHGYTFWFSYVSTSIGFALAIAVVGVLVRRMANHYEIYDYADILATRYSSREGAIRTLTAGILPIIYVPLLSAQFIAMATIVSATLNLPYGATLIGIMLLVVGYTVLGGMMGVVWSDGFQFLVLLFGLILAVPVAMASIGSGDPFQGWTNIVSMSQTQFHWSTEHWPWYLVLGQLVFICAIPAQPHLVTRFLTARDEKAILISLPVCMLFGLIIYASTVPLGLIGRYAHPDLATGEYYYIELARQHLGPWLGAFALAGISAAALSTSSTILMVAGQSFSRELYQKYLMPDADEKNTLRIARLAVLIVGLIGFAVAYFDFLGIFWLVILSASLLASVYFVPLMGGFFWRDASGSGAIAAMIAGGIVATTVFIVNESLGTHYFISEFFAGMIASVLAMWIVSKRNPATEAERTVMSLIRR